MDDIDNGATSNILKHLTITKVFYLKIQRYVRFRSLGFYERWISTVRQSAV